MCLLIDPILYDRSRLGDPMLIILYRAQIDGSFPQSIQFIQLAFDRYISYKMVHLILLGTRFLEFEKALPADKTKY